MLVWRKQLAARETEGGPVAVHTICSLLLAGEDER